FYRQVAEVTDPEIRELVVDVLSEEGRAEFIAAKVKQAVAEEPTLAGRLALWARRLVGEALSQAQRVALDRPQLAELLAKGDSSEERNGDLAAVSRIFARLTESHNARLQAMGLAGWRRVRHGGPRTRPAAEGGAPGTAPGRGLRRGPDVTNCPGRCVPCGEVHCEDPQTGHKALRGGRTLSPGLRGRVPLPRG